MMKTTILLVILFLMTAPALLAQEKKKDKKFFVTTGAGINKIQGSLHNTFRHTIAFNSGFERQLGHNWFAQAEANFNALKYDQQKTDMHSDYLFQNTNSTLFMLGVNAGRDFLLGKSNLFVSPYAGAGYINIGEPRLELREHTNIISQRIVRQSGILGKAGGRIGYVTKSKLLQTIYVDGSYWTSTAKISQLTVRSVSVFVGIRMTM